MPIARTIYYCQHCQRRRLMDRRKIELHEAGCWSNPENKSCPSCLYGHSRYVENDETGSLKKIFECIIGVVKPREFGEEPPFFCENWVHQDDCPDEEGDES